MQSMKYIRLTEANDLPDIEQFAPFKVLLSVDDPVSTERQKDISNWLVKMGALHVTVRGENCQAWKESIRQANVNLANLDDMLPEQFVMITTHQFEGLRSVFRQIKKYARHTHVDLKFTVIIHLSQIDGETEYLSIFSRL